LLTAQPEVTKNLHLNATAASKLTDRQIQHLTGSTENAQTINSVLNNATAEGLAAGVNHRSDIVESLGTGDASALNMALNQFKQDLSAAGLQEEHLAQIHNMDDKSLAEAIKAGKL
jgi:hypothetical protein